LNRFIVSPRICTSCPLPHVTTDWYQIEYNHPRRGETECAAEHERRIPLEVRDFGTGRPADPPKPPRPPKKQTNALEQLLAGGGRRRLSRTG
jgi:hypothetical protein